MLQFKNKTSFSGTILLTPDPNGIDTIYTIIKATFNLRDEVTLSEDQLPIMWEDQYHGDPGCSSLRLSSDVGLIKPGTDVLLAGSAYAANGKKVQQLDVSLNIGALKKNIRVFGDRVWKADGKSSSSPIPFEKMPLMWEKAFGGVARTESPAGVIEAGERNPVGKGFWGKLNVKSVDGWSLPNLEDPRQLVSTVKDCPQPMAFAPICASWEPRWTYAGTYDEHWEKKRSPYLPIDFDEKFFQVSSSDQVIPGYLRGKEEVEILGVTPNGPLRFLIPEYSIHIKYLLDNEKHVKEAKLDQVLIQPDDSQLVLTWKTCLQCDKKTLRVREIEAKLNDRM